MNEPETARHVRPLKFLAYLVLGVTVSAGVLVLVKAASRKPPAAAEAPVVSAPPVTADEASKVLADLRRKGENGPITDALIAEIHAAGNRWNPIWAAAHPADQDSPFDLLAASLVTRRAEAAAQTFAELQGQVETDLRGRKYAAALEALAKYRADPPLEPARRELVTAALARLDSDLAAVEEHGNALAEAGRFPEAARWFAGNAARFRGTDRQGRVASRPDSIAEIARVEELRRRREAAETQARADEAIRQIFAPPAPVAPASGPPTAAPAPPALNPFLAKLVEKVNAKERFQGKKYDYSAGISGPPAAASTEGLTVGGARIPWAGVPAETLFTMALDSFHGEDWIIAAEYAIASGQRTFADRFLWKYAGGTDRKQRQAGIDEFLTRVRGLKSTPEGGFTYDPVAGWEDRLQRANRTAVDDVGRQIKSFLSATETKRRDEHFDKLRAMYLQQGLAEDTREKVRVAIADALLELKRDRVDDLNKKAKATAGLGQLRALKLLLKERRAEAIKVIYDPKIYLPEDDPRWGQGDKINGQQKVDELVEAVREIWEQPARLVLANSHGIQRDMDDIRAINERYFPAFGLEADTEKDFAAFEEVRNNLNEHLNVKSYSLNGGDRADYEWNRRVDRYNEGLKEAGVGRDEIDHARTVNDYREMMGRRRLFLDARLCRATKKHSAVCDRAGRIWHVGSDGDPESRARAEGFTGGVSENVAIGYSSPSEIWTRGWYRASDHHRNGLSDSWNCIGYGYVGRVGTENFSNIGNPKGF
jgi:hypothetical protein